MKLILPKSLVGFLITLLSTQAFAIKVTVPALTLALGPVADATPASTPTAASTSPATVTKTLYSLDAAEKFKTDTAGDYYIQLGCFTKKENAEKLLKEVKFRTDDPVAMVERNGFYIVTMGPYHSADDVRGISQILGLFLPKGLPKEQCKTPPAVADKTEKTETTEQSKKPEKPAPAKVAAVHHHHRPLHERKYKDNAYVHIKLKREHGSWYIAGDLGVWAPIVDNTMTVNNGTGFPGAAGFDTYSTNTRWGGSIGLGTGYRWDGDYRWLPSYSLGLRYQHLFASNIGQQITQFSTPGFTNYNYSLNVASDVVMIATKVDLVRLGQLLPFVNAGIGISFNRVSNYNEIPLAGVTPRDFPGFANNSSHGLAYVIGAGLDWQVHPQLIMSVNYEFQGLGSINTRDGINSWSGSHLHSGTYQSNNVLLSMSYLLGK
jgi:opacity protein-like surface antigen